MQPLKRYPRIDRDVSIDVHEDENANLWAISYADFLMALLSFFILFFSLDNSGQDKIIQLLNKEFSESKQNNYSRQQSLAETTNTSDLFKALNNLPIKVQKTSSKLSIDFPDNIFPVGKHVTDAKNNEFIKTVLQKLLPYKEKINIYFEGHADTTPSHRKIQSIVVDNFVLSSLRAATALSAAKDLGYDEKTLFIQAASSHQRNSRSLSLHIFLSTEEK